VSRWQEAKGLKSRSGQAVVEFALILPAFVVLVFGALEFGDAFYDMHLITNAARCGARLGCLPGKVETNVSASVTSFMTAVHLTGSYTTATAVTDSTGATRTGGLVNAQEGDTVTVTVSYPFAVRSGSIVPGLRGTMTLHGRCAFRHE
jgi:Flp pilus assembly protein TadG